MLVHPTAAPVAIDGPNGLQVARVWLHGGGSLDVMVAAGTPSLTAAVVSPLEGPLPVRLRVEPPQGATPSRAPATRSIREGQQTSITLLDPAPGTWRIGIEAAEPAPPVLLQVIAAAQDEARDSLLAACASLPDDTSIPGIPRGVPELLLPVAIALRPLCGAAIDLADAIHAAPLIAAADLTGADPDLLADALAALPRDADLPRTVTMLAATAGL